MKTDPISRAVIARRPRRERDERRVSERPRRTPPTTHASPHQDDTPPPPARASAAPAGPNVGKRLEFALLVLLALFPLVVLFTGFWLGR